jgi:nucleoside-diphosphate kinase
MMVWEGNQAVAMVTKITGTTEPATSDVGTIRGDLTLDSYNIATVDNRAVRNLIHCSESPAEAKREIDIWFTDADMTEYRLLAEEILYDVNLDGILE